tara:strand:+ start:238 stop:552 length:315 start_codon:yes stop_codon:yes gene_type:complete
MTNTRTRIDLDAYTQQPKARIQAEKTFRSVEGFAEQIGDTTTLFVQVYCDGDLLVHPHGFELPCNDDPGLAARAFLKRVIADGTIDRSKWEVVRYAGELVAAYA